jgi:hypothetical protein
MVDCWGKEGMRINSLVAMYEKGAIISEHLIWGRLSRSVGTFATGLSRLLSHRVLPGEEGWATDPLAVGLIEARAV